MSSITKNILIFAALAAVAYLGYYIFVANKESSLENQANSEGQILTTEFLQRLNDIEGINLSRAVFEDARFHSLIDFSTVPDSVPAGRSNPFTR